MHRIRRATCQNRAAPHRLTPQMYCENTGIHTLPYFQTCTLSHASHANCHLLTEPPHDWATSWLSYSIVSYLLITLPLDWAIQLWATSWLLCHLTELPLDYSTTWLSYSIVSYLLIIRYHLTALSNCSWLRKFLTKFSLMSMEQHTQKTWWRPRPLTFQTRKSLRPLSNACRKSRNRDSACFSLIHVKHIRHLNIDILVQITPKQKLYRSSCANEIRSLLLVFERPKRFAEQSKDDLSTTLLLGGECSEGRPSKESDDSSEESEDSSEKLKKPVVSQQRSPRNLIMRRQRVPTQKFQRSQQGSLLSRKRSLLISLSQRLTSIRQHVRREPGMATRRSRMLQELKAFSRWQTVHQQKMERRVRTIPK